MQTKASINLAKSVTSTNDVTLHAESDCNGSGAINIASISEISAGSLNVFGGSLKLDGYLNSDIILFREYCSASDSIGLGGTSLSHTLSLNDTELLRIKNHGTTTFNFIQAHQSIQRTNI